jgi:undecaprenyl diphosphate synthase
MILDLDKYIEPGSEEEHLVWQLDLNRIPEHIAVIMDGNGRWAKQRNLPRVEGHREGSNSVREIVEASARLGIRYLTLYAFSKENWKRPKREVSTLWKLLEDYLKKEYKVLEEKNLCLRVVGERNEIPSSVRMDLEKVENLTRNNSRMTINLALNYGGRSEIVEAVKRICQDKTVDISLLDEATFSRFLFTHPCPDPDLLIRTSGELRISNFLLWQIAYTEIWTTEVLWPDFRKKHLLQAVVEFQKRERRYGDIHSMK